MFARVSTFQVAGDHQDAAHTALGGPPPTEVQELEGFRGAYTMLSHETGKAMLITLWDTEQSMQASAEQAKQVRARTVQNAGASEAAQVETFEVLSHP